MGYSIDVREAKGNNDKLKGVASIVIDDSFKVRNISIIEGKKGLFVSMPRLKSQDKEGNTVYKDVCHPIKADFRKQLYEDILSTFQEAMKSEERHARFEAKDIKESPDLNVSVYPVNKENSTLKGVAKIYLNDNFIVENIPIRAGKDGKAFVAMPSYQAASSGEYKYIVHPVTADFKKKLDEQILGQLEQSKDMEVNLEENPFEPGTFDNRAVKEAEKTIEQPDVPFPDAKNLKWCVIEQKEGLIPQLIVYDSKDEALQYAENTWANAREYSRRSFDKLEVELHNVDDKGYGYYDFAMGADGKLDTKVYDKAKGLADFRAEDKAQEAMSFNSLKQDLAEKKVAEKAAPKAEKTNKSKDMEIGG